jgi:hypothetical protein
MTDKGNKIQPSAWIALLALSLFASAAFGIIGLVDSGMLEVHTQIKSGEKDTTDGDATVQACFADGHTHQDPAITGLVSIRVTENPHVISDACLPDTLHGPPGSRITTV